MILTYEVVIVGFADGPHRIKASLQTIYHWWSMTNILAKIAILQFPEQAKLDLRDNVSDYLPGFAVIDRSDNRPIFTVQQLLRHSSWLPDTMPAMIGWVHYEDVSYDQTKVLKQHLAEFNTFKFEPSTQAVYSNLNFMVLGAVIEAVTGQSYESYIDEHILHPFGMSQTGFVVSPAMADHEAGGTMPIVHLYIPFLPTLLDTKALLRERMRVNCCG